MNEELYKKIANSTVYRSSREENAALILNEPSLFCYLVSMALHTTDTNHFKACWILEIVLVKRLQLITDSLPEFCSALSDFTNDSATRAVAKICMFISRHLSLTVIQEQQITESCFDWLINTNKKVATKVYAARALYELGKTRKWIYPELERILTDDYPKHSSAYKAAAREILKKIK